MSAVNFYDLLGISKTASKSKVKSSYRKLVIKYHPDKAVGDKKAAEKKFKEISAAYEVLKDPEKRQQYDQSEANKANQHIPLNALSSFRSPLYDDVMKKLQIKAQLHIENVLKEGEEIAQLIKADNCTNIKMIIIPRDIYHENKNILIQNGFIVDMKCKLESEISPLVWNMETIIRWDVDEQITESTS